MEGSHFSPPPISKESIPTAALVDWFNEEADRMDADVRRAIEIRQRIPQGDHRLENKLSELAGKTDVLRGLQAFLVAHNVSIEDLHMPTNPPAPT